MYKCRLSAFISSIVLLISCIREIYISCLEEIFISEQATEQGLSKITLTEIEDQMHMVERKVVVIAIHAEKTKLTDIYTFSIAT